MDVGLSMILAAVLPSIFKGIFGQGTQQQERVTETEIPPRGYQSPLLGMADMTAFENLLRNMQSYSGWGWPSGSGRGQASPQIAEILKLLQGEWPKMMEGGMGGMVKPSTALRSIKPSRARV